jgi:hypothetical protein
VSDTAYRYELWRGGELFATGRFANDAELEEGDPIEIGSHRGVVREITATTSSGEMRLVVDVGSN